MIPEASQVHLEGRKSGTDSAKKRAPSVTRRSLDARESLAIRHLTRFSMMTSEQLAVSTGRGIRSAQKAMAGLTQKGLACYGGLLPEDFTVDSPQKPKRVYSLNKDGVTYVEHHGCSWALTGRKPVARNWGGRLIQDNEIHHKLGIVDCMIWLCRSVDTFASLDLVRMTPDFIRDEDKQSVNKDTFGDGNLIPDVVAVIMNTELGATKTLFIEYDRGTSPIWTESKENGRSLPLCERFVRYNRYFGKKERKTSASNPMLLWVFERDSRLQAVQSSPRLEWSKWANIDERVRMTNADRAATDFLDGLWDLPDTDERAPVIERTAT